MKWDRITISTSHATFVWRTNAVYTSLSFERSCDVTAAMFLFPGIGILESALRNDAPFALRKRSFISTVRPTVYTNLSQKRSFSKTVFKREKFDCGRKNSLPWNEVCRKLWLLHDDHLISLAAFSLKTNPKLSVFAAIWNFFGVM